MNPTGVSDTDTGPATDVAPATERPTGKAPGAVAPATGVPGPEAPPTDAPATGAPEFIEKSNSIQSEDPIDAALESLCAVAKHEEAEMNATQPINLLLVISCAENTIISLSSLNA